MRLVRAFTLLEVLVALAILGVSLLAIIDINAQAVAAHLYAKKLTVATLLARSKMTDIEQQMYDKGLTLDDDEDSGDFSDEGWPGFKWRSKIIAPKTNGLSPEQLIGALFNLPIPTGKDAKDGKDPLAALFGGGGLPGGMPGLPGGLPGGMAGAAGAAAGGAAGGGGLMAMLGPMGGQFTQMVDLLTKSVREVHLTVTWKEGRQTESFDIVTHIVSLGPGSDRNGGAVAAAGGNATAAADQWVRADNGQPVANPRPAPGGGGMVDPVDNSPVISAAQYQAQRGGMPGGIPGLLPPGGMPGQLPRQLVPMGAGTIQKQGIFQ